MATPYHICTSDLCGGELSVTTFSAAKYRLELGGRVRQAPPVYFGRSVHPSLRTWRNSPKFVGRRRMAGFALGIRYYYTPKLV